MTSVDIQTINGVTIVSVAGHAGYNPGNDIVCASISAITLSLLQTLKYYEKQGICRVLNDETKEDIGTALISYMSRNKEVTNAVLNMAEIGYMMLENTYPKNICVNIE